MLSVDLSSLVIFALVWVLALILSKIFFKPVGRILDERASKMADSRESTSRAVKGYENDIRRIEDSLKEAKAAAAALREKAEAEALADKSRAILELQTESRAQLEKAREELKRQVDILKKELDGHIDEVAAQIEKRILD